MTLNSTPFSQQTSPMILNSSCNWDFFPQNDNLLPLFAQKDLHLASRFLFKSVTNNPIVAMTSLTFLHLNGCFFFFLPFIIIQRQKKTQVTVEINTLFSYFLSSQFEWVFLFFFSLPFLIRPQKKNTSDQRNQQTLLQFIIAMSVSFLFFPNLNECFLFFSSNFEWAFHFFFLLQIHYYKHKCGQKEYSVGGVNRRKKRTARQLLAMTTTQRNQFLWP